MSYPAALSPAEIDDLFVNMPPPEKGTFEVALVLGGTVSAGSYTAGALDFLFEALDIWTRLRDEGNPAAPTHRVQIRVIAGTSGGGVNAAIAARALAFNYPPISRGTAVQGVDDAVFGKLSGNPFYDVWCRMLQLDGFLDCSDLAHGEPQSLLNGGPINQAADHIAGFTGEDRAVPRPWVGEPMRNDPLRVILTLTNLHGIPYRTTFEGPPGEPIRGETFVDHADYIRFAMLYPGQTAFDPRPDETVLSFDATTRTRQAASWFDFSQFARATAAFPLGFPARVLNRTMLDYRYRVAVLPPGPDGKPNVQGLTPDWDQLAVGGALASSYSFVAVDGGATDNEPIALARVALAGLQARSARDPEQANRCVLLIDPFSGEAGLGVPPGGILSVATGTLNALLQQTRYDTADLLLAADPAVFSRFLVSANRDNLIGSKAIATGGVGAFIGFACPAFMRHDYLLGRANCRQMLATRFGVVEDNPVVAGHWTPAQIKANSFALGGKTLLRLIPLLGNAAIPESTDPWPVNALDPDQFHGKIDTRWRTLLGAEGKGWFERIKLWAGGLLTEGAVADFAAKKMRDDLVSWGLLPPDRD